ncbi:ABC transporter ATP-binding protein [Shewanella sp. 1_MG-2023]|uniref:ABC transporter ATP-binding protein n=1 Tax=unclassified Shewanella TaxID=196818 RepID=UPI000C859DC6|nr:MULTISPECIES: ABC transporter ATP-binding protein [unclassified Shewanella]MDO6610855.1 ABC transporter ATP-binding protein [Shewanella sp. 7_MG-2023]MDO6770294.1 ABC transporter ATP-binding protein [Shewanella sp. 2_MG-2023]MDO6793435.1 ABC transporter ATP-binding protein [Shewanella sp. 1_MG-2023]PMG77065.1 ABC transporter [Shewanella sp. 10N.286.51.B7]
MKLITCEGVSKQYGTKAALSNINLSLDTGAPIALVGPNGAGKTTLFSLLCGFIHPSSGEISILGEKPGSQKLQNVVSALPQDAALDPNFTIVSQLTFFGKLQGMNGKQAKQEALRVLELVDLSASALMLPKSLSHGMSKRVSIAQALMGSPKLVLLDEPTAGLDPANAKKIRQIVKDLSATTTFVISSHNLEELEKLCDQVLYLEQGQLQQSVSMKADAETAFLTLTMQQSDIALLSDKVRSMPNIINVKVSDDEQIIIEHHFDTSFNLETALLTLFSEHGWQYKAIMKGRSLEETLFSS